MDRETRHDQLFGTLHGARADWRQYRGRNQQCRCNQGFCQRHGRSPRTVLVANAFVQRKFPLKLRDSRYGC